MKSRMKIRKKIKNANAIQYKSSRILMMIVN